MKKGLFILMFLIPLFGISQTTRSIESFLGIKFGAGQSEALDALKAKGAKFEKDNSCCGQLVFLDAKFETRTAYSLSVNFVNDKAYQVEYTFAQGDDAKVIEEYNKLVAEMIAVYGPGRITTKYSPPFKADGGDILHGISEGQIDFHTTWLDDINKVTVIVRIDSTMRVNLIYQDDGLFELAVRNHIEVQRSN
jgi:hypothetical protein